MILQHKLLMRLVPNPPFHPDVTFYKPSPAADTAWAEEKLYTGKAAI